MDTSERERLLRQLSEWEPGGGVLSVYVRVDPADRGMSWWTTLRDGLRELVRETEPHDTRRAFEAASARVLEHFPDNGPPPAGRGHVGFVEVASEPDEVWRTMQMAPRQVEVVHSRRPYLRPLIQLFDEGPHVGVVLVSSERVRLLEWSLGALRELDDWEIVLWSGDWRELKAERSVPGKAEGTSASGRDQFGQRLEANRHRFLREVGQRVGLEMGRCRWRHLLVFGSEPHAEGLTTALGAERRHAHVVPHDLISAKDGEIAERVQDEIAELKRDRERALVEMVEEAIGSDTGAALGPREVLEALREGRVRHLIFDADRDYESASIAEEPAYRSPEGDGLPVAERMIELAVATSAEITPVEGGPAAETLSRHGGIAALLRY